MLTQDTRQLLLAGSACDSFSVECFRRNDKYGCNHPPFPTTSWLGSLCPLPQKLDKND
jgi:hypothetical protein